MACVGRLIETATKQLCKHSEQCGSYNPYGYICTHDKWSYCCSEYRKLEEQTIG